MAHSINFAKKLPFVDRIILSTDDPKYAEIGAAYGAEIPFLRSPAASADTAMEEDILDDMRQQCDANGIKLPPSVVWLRPTHPLRDVLTYQNAYHKMASGKYTSVCVVTEEDPRIFGANNGALIAQIPEFEKKSMVRRQDCAPAYRIFGGELFNFPLERNIRFLGEHVGYEVAPKGCKFDIDHQEDLDYLEFMLKTKNGKALYGELLHTQ